jgi:hypothetical protein
MERAAWESQVILRISNRPGPLPRAGRNKEVFPSVKLQATRSMTCAAWQPGFSKSQRRHLEGLLVQTVSAKSEPSRSSAGYDSVRFICKALHPG